MKVNKVLHRITRLSFILVPLFLLLTTTAVSAASVSLRWDPNDPAPEGYRVFARKSGQAYNYSQPDWEGAATACTISTLEGETDYYFVVRAYEGSQESADSAEVHFVPPVADNDGDGMPDEWEAHFGLNPLVDDADGDLDGDGISNRDEFRAGLEPDDQGMGDAPLPPEPLSPESDTQVKTNPLLVAGEYSDTEGDAHIASQWQIYDADTDDCLLDVVTDRRLDQLRVPCLLLKGNETYYWQVRFLDSGGRASAWSAASTFVTEGVADDLNGNGVSDDQEGGDIQADVSRSLSMPAADNRPTEIVVASQDTILAIEQVVLLDPAEFEVDETTPDQLPSAMLAYKLLLDQPGQRALVTIHLSDPAPEDARWLKYDAVNGWQDYSDYTAFSADRQSVTVEVKDGAFGDADGVANGIILDPAGLSTAEDAASSASSSGGGGGGGCFISAVRQAGDQSASADGPWQWIRTRLNRLMAEIGRP
jgi:hypothetical protein